MLKFLQRHGGNKARSHEGGSRGDETSQKCLISSHSVSPGGQGVQRATKRPSDVATKGRAEAMRHRRVSHFGSFCLAACQHIQRVRYSHTGAASREEAIHISNRHWPGLAPGREERENSASIYRGSWRGLCWDLPENQGGWKTSQIYVDNFCG